MPAEQQQPESFKLEDIYFLLFRQKWKIIICSLLGVVAALVIFFLHTPMYESEAKLLLRYVMEQAPNAGVSGTQQIKTPDVRGENIINSEIEILRNWALAEQVVKEGGLAARILGMETTQTNKGGLEIPAAALLMKHLTIQVPPKSSIILLRFAHQDSAVPQLVLDELVKIYFKKHREIRSAKQAYEFLAAQADQIRGDLSDTEARLAKKRQEGNIVSLEDSKLAITSELNVLRKALFDAETELAERKTSSVGMSNIVSGVETSIETSISQGTQNINSYVLLSRRLDMLRMQEMEWGAVYTDANPKLVGLRKQIQNIEDAKHQMETLNPGLASLGIESKSGAPADGLAERLSNAQLEARISGLKEQMERLRGGIVEFDKFEGEIMALQRERDLREENFRYISRSLEQARIDQALSSIAMSNISEVQPPSPPLRQNSKLKKLIGSALAAGILGGLALAFLVEHFFDQTMKRPVDLTGKFKMPVFVTLPKRRFKAPARSAGLKGIGPGTALVRGEAEGLLDPETQAELTPYFEALRDRLLLHFEQNNLTHKPKIIGLTSCSRGAGVTTMATGLAAALSETGEGRVLLVDLNLTYGAAHPFFQGKPVCGLGDLLKNGNHRDSAQVQEGLYVASAAGSNGTNLSVRSKQFVDLFPKLKASDYDYIVFDLPPIHQTSVTFRLAGYMDKVMLVVEAEQTSAKAIEQAAHLLKQSGAEVSGILNKTNNPLPKWMSAEA